MNHICVVRRYCCLPLLVCAVLGLSGCGGSSFQPVRGEVFHQGKPAVGATVIFHPLNDTSPTAIRPSGIVAEDGSYTLTSLKTGDGAPPGDYVVCISWPQEKAASGPSKGMGGGEDKSTSRDRLGGKYLTQQGSPLRRSVTKGTAQIERLDVP